MNLLDDLNPAQSQAVRIISGPVLVLAGAGSGKTKTLTHRIAYLIDHEGVWPDQILAVTFTNKAAKEMRERLAILLNMHQESRQFMPYMGTFHGICVKILRISGQSIGVLSNFTIYDEDDRRGLIKQAMKQLRITDKQIKPSLVSQIISSSKNQLITSAEYKNLASYPFQQKIADIFEKYENLRIGASALDFDDLLIETVRLFRESNIERDKWRSRFKYILIDEYQDTNAAQYAIIKSLVSEEKNICVVGDDWQSIYSWRGADFTNILNFERDFPGAKVIKLEQNYRNTNAILNAAQNVILKNEARTDKKLWTSAGEGAPVEVHSLYDEAEEANLVATRISVQQSIGARNYSDFAVLYRTNAQSYLLERSFLQKRIPYQIVGGVRFYDRKEVKDIISYLKLLFQPNDRVSFSRIVNIPSRGIGEVSLFKFLEWQFDQGLDIVSALNQVTLAPGLQARVKKALLNIGEILHDLQSDLETSSPSELIERLIFKVNYRDYLLDGSPQAEDREANIGALVSDAKSFASLGDFLEEVALMSSVDETSAGQKVTLMTMHAAKGLEFPVVFMVGMEEGIMPHSRVYEAGKAELEEERRLCYVAMTRAREELHLSYSASRLQFGSRSYNSPSRFISDMGVGVVSSPIEHDLNGSRQSDSWEEYPSFEVGDCVNSTQFGDGEIIDVDGLAVTIKFESGQTKKLNIEYARLAKL